MARQCHDGKLDASDRRTGALHNGFGAPNAPFVSFGRVRWSIVHINNPAYAVRAKHEDYAARFVSAHRDIPL
jgi:hypothetical protein